MVNISWYSWPLIWKLKVAPRNKNFIWMLMYNRIKTFEFLRDFNISLGSILYFVA